MWKWPAKQNSKATTLWQLVNTLPTSSIRQSNTTIKLMLLLGVTAFATITSNARLIAIALKRLDIVGMHIFLAIEY